MFRLLEILTLILISIAMALSLAHALELPGKLRLKREAYLVMQSIYYPGFTYGGASEPISILAVVVLLVLKPAGSSEFWLTLAALIGLASMHAIFWLVTQPVSAREAFNSKGPAWTVLRDRWEYSHLARAVLAVTAFVLLLIAMVP